MRGYYAMPETLDVDRYKLGDDGGSRRTSSSPPASSTWPACSRAQRNWANDHTVYTHGYGIVAARGNQRGPQGEPVWVEKDIPPDR